MPGYERIHSFNVIIWFNISSKSAYTYQNALQAGLTLNKCHKYGGSSICRILLMFLLHLFPYLCVCRIYYSYSSGLHERQHIFQEKKTWTCLCDSQVTHTGKLATFIPPCTKRVCPSVPGPDLYVLNIWHSFRTQASQLCASSTVSIILDFEYR